MQSIRAMVVSVIAIVYSWDTKWGGGGRTDTKSYVGVIPAVYQ